MKKKTFKLVSEYGLNQYSCGLCAGESIVLLHDLPVISHDGRPTGIVHRKGEVWTVLSGSKGDRVVFLRQPDGKRHTWDDDPSIFETFQRTAIDVSSDD